jgi:hypothetical protein
MLVLIAFLATLIGCSAFVYSEAIKAGESRIIGIVVAPMGGLIITTLIWWAGISAWAKFRDKTGPLPLELDVAEEVFSAESGGFREGCGVFVYRLTEASRTDLSKKGLAKLRSARSGRLDASYHRYNEWKPMPTDFYVRGQSCVDVPTDIAEIISQALKSGFVTSGYEFDLLVDPVTGIVVYSFNG